MNMSEVNNSKRVIRLPLIIALAVLAGIFIGSRMLEPKMDEENISTSITKFREVLTRIDNNYVDEVESNGLVEDAIREMLDKLDPHSRYIPAEQVASLNAQLQGHYDGIGIQFVILQDTVYVVRAMDDGPSKAQGILTGDKIIKVGDENLFGSDVTSSDVADRLLGPSDTQVTITVLRGTESIEFTIERGKIPQYSVPASYMVDDRIGYIKVSNFGDKTYDEFKSALEKLKSEGMERLVIDLQGNPGGRMDAAEKLSDELISGKRLIVSQKSAHKQYNLSSYARNDGIFEDGPVIVLVDESSASASEIVSGALQDHDRALIVGRRTYGKGLVQLPITLVDKSEMMLTIARYYTPSGRSIQKPYEDSELYHSDLTARYNRGEFFYEDSIKFIDSLKFETAKGRVVYGGGGIMPDHFVPYDTANYTSYYRKLLARGVLRKFTIDFYVSNKEYLSGLEMDWFLADFEITDTMLQKILAIGDRFEVEFNREEYNTSLSLIKSYVKADIAEFVWNDEGFYQVINPASNEIYNRALELFDEANRLAQAYN